MIAGFKYHGGKIACSTCIYRKESVLDGNIRPWRTKSGTPI